jgi:hypothetical protein
MKKRTILTILGLILLVGALGGIKVLQIRRMIDHGAQFTPPAEVVTTAVTQAASWESLLSAVGSLVAVQGVIVTAELPGKVVRIAFEPGQKVQTGDPAATSRGGQFPVEFILASTAELDQILQFAQQIQLNAVTISGVAIRPLAEALSYLEDEAAKILPKGYIMDYTGESRQLRTEGNKFLPAFGLAVVLIFLVLAAQFNSFRDPFVILAGSVPLAMFGALIFTFLKIPDPNVSFWTHGWTTTLNIYSQVGLVTLVGLVSKNGILIVEFANKLQEGGRSKQEAVHEAAVTRLRPILMTSAATIAGHFPLTLVTGAGAAARNSIGLVLVGGMAVGTLFTLFVVPSIYMLVARDHAKVQAGKASIPSN